MKAEKKYIHKQRNTNIFQLNSGISLATCWILSKPFLNSWLVAWILKHTLHMF